METLRKQILDKVKQVLDDNAKIILDGVHGYIRAHGEPLTEEDVQLVEGEVAKYLFRIFYRVLHNPYDFTEEGLALLGTEVTSAKEELIRHIEQYLTNGMVYRHDWIPSERDLDIYYQALGERVAKRDVGDEWLEWVW